MKNKTLFLAAVCLALCFAACNKDGAKENCEVKTTFKNSVLKNDCYGFGLRAPKGLAAGPAPADISEEAFVISAPGADAEDYFLELTVSSMPTEEEKSVSSADFASMDAWERELFVGIMSSFWQFYGIKTTGNEDIVFGGLPAAGIYFADDKGRSGVAYIVIRDYIVYQLMYTKKDDKYDAEFKEAADSFELY